MRRLFYQPLGDVAAVEYRHQVFGDLERHRVRQSITDFTDAMAMMRARLRQAEWVQDRWQRHGFFVHAAFAFCNAVTALRHSLAHAELSSRGLRDIATHLGDYADSDRFRALAADTQAVLTALGGIRYTVHIHDRQVRVEKYSGQIDYSVEVLSLFERFASEIDQDFGVPIKSDAEMNTVERRILECVARLYPDVFADLDEFVRRHQDFVEPDIARFDCEIRFYLRYAAFIERFSADVDFSYPEVTDTPGILFADTARDLALALKIEGQPTMLVSNAFHLSGNERVLVVTGPNQGGKTTFARTIGQCAYLASLGCPVPARSAAFTLSDTVYTHFDRQENLAAPHGKLHDELVRIREILARATARSLVIMNESFSSTTVSDARQIGTDIIKRIVRLGSAAVYVSFLDDLAHADPACVSMVGEVATDDPTRRTFSFTRRPPDGLAYAAALADKYGLTYDAIRQRITA